MGFEGGAVMRGRAGVAAGPKPGLKQAFEALRHRDYRILWASQAFSFMGMQMQQIARGLLAYQLTGSYAGMGVILMGWGLSQLVFGLFGGAVADRVNKRNVIIVAQAGTGFLCALTAASITFGFISVELLFLTGVAQGTLFAFNMPARQALVAELVPQPVLMNAIALNNVVMNATRIIGPATAGVVIGFGDAQLGARGIEIAYYVQALMYLGVLAILMFLPPSTSHLHGAAQRRGILTEIGLGLKYMLSSRNLLILTLLAFASTLVGMPYMTLLPGFAVAELGVAPTAFGIMSSVTGIGAIVGSLFIATISAHPRKPLLQMIFGIGFGAGLIALGLGSAAFGYPGALAALLAVGLFSTSFQTINNTMLMAQTRPEFYGRVMSVYMLTFSLFPLMSAPLGVVADQISATTTFIGMGALIVAFVSAISLLTPRWTFGRSSDEEISPPGRTSAQSAAASSVAAPAPVLAAAALVGAGDSGGARITGVVRGTPAATRRPRRDYLGGSAGAPSRRDYMGSAAAPPPTAAARPKRSPAEPSPSVSEPIAFPGTGTYGLVARRASGAPASPLRRNYGFEPPAPPLRSVGGVLPIEAGDAAATVAPIPAGAAVAAAAPVGRFLPAPTEHVQVRSARPGGAEPSSPVLIAALVAAVSTSILALFVRHAGQR